MLDLKHLSDAGLIQLAKAAQEALFWLDALGRGGADPVSEMLRGQGTFYELQHYPENDVFDAATQSQYYYHAHRGGEHGHFHLFLRKNGHPAGMHAPAQSAADYLDNEANPPTHLAALSMNSMGEPIGLFTTNRWVTAECWHAAPAVTAMLDLFSITHARQSWPVNRWLRAMVRLYRHEIADLLIARDQAMDAFAARHRGADAFEDRRLEIISAIAISLPDKAQAVDAERARRGLAPPVGFLLGDGAP